MSRYTTLTDWYVPTTGIKFRTTKEVCWEIGKIDSGLWLVAPAGYEFDVSIPRALRWIFDPKDPRYLKAAALHDWALDLGWDRVSAAAAFSEAMRAQGVSRARRLSMVLSVITYKFL